MERSWKVRYGGLAVPPPNDHFLVRPSIVGVIATAAAGLAALLGACSSAPVKPAVATSAAVDEGVAAIDPCEGEPPPPRKYFGPLRDARCEQEMFLTMSGIAEDLGVKCGYCHIPKEDNPKSFYYERQTPHKDIAFWMSETFMTGLKRKDGKPMDCASCHVDKGGNPAAKFLGEPRDLAWTVEWMTTVMANRFVLADGSKLKCKHCHVGAWGSSDFKPKVILQTEQVPHGTVSSDVPTIAAPSAAPSSALPSAVPSSSAPSPAPASSGR